MKESEKTAIVQSILDYVQILQMKGLDFSVPDQENLLKMEGIDLNRLLRQVRDLARTPTA